MKNPKKKGSTFERLICKELSLWVTDEERTDVFWRSAMSGGRATVNSRVPCSRGTACDWPACPPSCPGRPGKIIRQLGDICAVAPEGHELTDRFYIECKHLRQLSFSAFAFQRVGPLAKHWREVCARAAECLREPMLIAKQNNTPTLVLLAWQRGRTDLGSATPKAYLPAPLDCVVFLLSDILAEPYQVLIEDRVHLRRRA